MDGGTEILEWSIENFTCCNLGLQEAIKSPNLYEVWSYRAIYLYPRGEDGKKKNLEVVLHRLSRGFNGDISFIGSDGSLIVSRPVQIDPTNKEKNVKLLGLGLEDIVKKNRKNEALYHDTLTLRIRQVSSYSRKYHLRTRINVYDTSVFIPTEVFDFKAENCVNISVIIYPIVHSLEGELVLSTSKVDSEIDNSKVELSLQPSSLKYSFSVRTWMFLLNECDVRIYEKQAHTFNDDSKWTFSNSLTMEKVSKEGFSLLLRVKIVPREYYQHVCSYYSFFPKEVYIRPTFKSCVPKKISFKNVESVAVNQTGNPVEALAIELMCLYQDQDFSDFQLNCGNISFPIHRAILSARSPVFKRLLSSDMREAASGSVDIIDLDAPTLARFLIFLYSGSTEDLQWDSALKLYYAADKYQVPTLKKVCASVLSENVSISNVCDILSLADKHLTSVAHDFILKNFNQVLKSEEWMSFMKKEGGLLLRTLTYFAQKNYVGKS